ncbi:DNA-binding protein snt1, partial [Coemansia asiatica]
MSFNRKLSESSNSSSNRYRAENGESSRDFENRGYRSERSNSQGKGMPPLAYSSGVVRDRVRSGSMDRGQLSLQHSGRAGQVSQQGSGSSSYSRSQSSRWSGHDGRHRGSASGGGGGGGGEYDRGRRDRGYVSSSGSARLGGRHVSNSSDSSSIPPGLVSRRTISSTGRGSGSVPPLFSRRATEPGETLEEGELDADERGLGQRRTFTAPRVDPARRSGLDSESLQRIRAEKAFFHASETSAYSQVSNENKTPSPKMVYSEQSNFDEGSANKAVDVPKLELQSRISDIDREIAECQERLVQISAAGSDAARDEQPDIKPETSAAIVVAQTDDRTVPGSPAKQTGMKSKAADSSSATCEHVADKVHMPGNTSALTDFVAADIERNAIVTAAVVAAMVSGSPSLGPVVPQASVSGLHAELGCTEIDASFDSNSNLGSDSDPDSDIGADGNGNSIACGSKGRRARDRTNALVATIYAENQRRAAEMQAQLAAPFLEAYPRFVPGSYAEPTDWPFWEENELIHQQLRPHLARVLAGEKLHDIAHVRKLQEEYRDLYARWRRRVDRLDRQREAKQRAERGLQSPNSSSAQLSSTSHRRRAGAQAAAAAATDEFGFSLGPLFSASASAAAAVAAGSADNIDINLFTSDAVHSEAELQKIIERLQYDDARNPDLRSQRTAAVIPPMALSPKERSMLRVDNSNHCIEDPMTFYHARVPTPSDPEYRRVAYANNGDSDHYWTQTEVGQFVAAYLAHPKQFGRIAAAIPHKSMNDCVLFYYRNKKQLRLKELEARSNKRSRRSRQQSAANSGSRKRKERAKERREKRAREEREKIAFEAAASYVSSAETPVFVPMAEDTVATTAATSDDDAQQLSLAEDILDRRYKSSALLRSIIAANRQRKRGLSGSGELSRVGLQQAGTAGDEAEYEEEAEADGDGEAEEGVVSESNQETKENYKDAHLSARDGEGDGDEDDDDEDDDDDEIEANDHDNEHRGGLKRIRHPKGGDSSAVNSPSVSTVPSRSRQTDPDDDSLSLRDKNARRTSSTAKSDIGSLIDDDEEEGELVDEEKHPDARSARRQAQRRSRQRSELNAYAMGGSIVRTRRSREIEESIMSSAFRGDDAESNESESQGSDDNDIAADEDMDEIVEASGIVAAASDRGPPYLSRRESAKSDGSSKSRPRVVSRKSQSRFGVTLTAIIEPLAGEPVSDTDAPLSIWHGQPSRQKSAASLGPPGGTSADISERHLPTESALDRFVTDETTALKRPISSYETLLICSSASGISDPLLILSDHVNGAGNSNNSSASLSMAHSGSGAMPATAHKKMLESRVEEEAGPQDSVLVGAAVWLREDRRRVLRGFHHFGSDFVQVASLMPSKTMAQCRYFFYHYRTPAGVLISDMFSTGPNKPLAESRMQLQTRVDALVLPPSNRSQSTGTSSTSQGLVLPSAASNKRQRTRSPSIARPSSHVASSSDEEDDETPLAAQLAEELAAQAAADSSNSLPQTPVLHGQSTVSMAAGALATQQRRASEIIAQTRPELLLPRAPSIASLALPLRTASSSATGAETAAAAASGVPAVSINDGAGVVVSGSVVTSVANSVAAGRTPSPALQQASTAMMTAKKSGYSSYWSVHERSAFMHYIVRLGQDWLALAEAIGSKTGTQVRNYFRANREKLGLDAVIVEYQRNRLAGTVPPMTPFQPPPSLQQHVLSASGVGPGMSKEEGLLVPRKERRGRKRKNEIPKSALEQSGNNSIEAAPLAVRGDLVADGVLQPQAPNTAPATMASFPTMGIDGGRAVIFSRPPTTTSATVDTNVRPLQPPVVAGMPPRTRPPPTVLQKQQQQQQQQQHVWPHQHQHLSHQELARRSEGIREGSVARAESDTMSSQPTPPPVEGLPRFSSSPAPSMVYSYQQQQQMQYQAQSRPVPPPASFSALHISNLTNSTSPTEPTRGGSGSSSATGHHGYRQKQVEKLASPLIEEEPRKVSVTKINALLNDDSPTTSHVVSSADWFGEPEVKQPNVPVSNEDEATGIAALALASMMGAAATGRTPPMPARQPQQTRMQPSRTRPQSVSVTSDSRIYPSHSHYQQTSGPQPTAPTPSMSAFSPAAAAAATQQQSVQYHARGSPMMAGSPPQQQQQPLASHHLQTRPSSVGPSVSYGHMSPSMNRASPKRIIPPSGSVTAQQVGPMRQRKPSAPVPMHMTSSHAVAPGST